MAALACVIAVNKKHSLDATYNFGMLRSLSEFTLGIVLHQLYDKKIGENLLKKDISFFITVCLILTVMHYSWIDILIIPCFTCLILAAAYNRQSVQNLLRKRPMVFLGEISFSLYMTQAFWLNIYLVSLHVWADTFPGQDLSLKVKLFWLIIILAANILSAVFTHRYVEIPARNWIKKKTLQPVMAKLA